MSARRILIVSLLAATGCATVRSTSAPAPTRAAATELRFADLVSAATELGPSELARRLGGQRVRMVGFMAELESGPQGAFYLTPRPVRCDEAGAGTGDLPIESVLVSVPFMPGAQVPHVDGALEVTGTFDSGARVDAGYPSSFRIRLDEPARERLTSAAQ